MLNLWLYSVHVCNFKTLFILIIWPVSIMSNSLQLISGLLRYYVNSYCCINSAQAFTNHIPNKLPKLISTVSDTLILLNLALFLKFAISNCILKLIRNFMIVSEGFYKCINIYFFSLNNSQLHFWSDVFLWLPVFLQKASPLNFLSRPWVVVMSTSTIFFENQQLPYCLSSGISGQTSQI